MTMQNSRGQESKYLTGIPALILVIMLVGILIVWSFVLAGSRGSGVIAEGRSTGSVAGVLLEPLEVGEEQMLVLDALLAVDANRISRAAMEQGLSSLLVRRGEGCLLLAVGEGPEPGGRPGGAALNDFYVRAEQGNARGANMGAYPSLFAPYRDAGALEATSVVLRSGHRAYVEYYQGECVE